MAAASRRRITITYSGDVEGVQEIDADGNASSPAQVTQVTLPQADVDVEVEIPDGATAVTIVKPDGLEQPIMLKGTADDTGVALSPTEPDSISVDSSMTSFFLTNTSPESGDVTVRLFWS